MKKMLTGVVSALALTLLAACGANAAASAAGHYELDKAAMKAALPGDAGAMVDGMTMTMDLKADGTATAAMSMDMMGKKIEDSRTGTWKLDGGKLTVTMKDKDGKEEVKTVDYKDGSFTVEGDMGGQKLQMTYHKK